MERTVDSFTMGEPEENPGGSIRSKWVSEKKTIDSFSIGEPERDRRVAINTEPEGDRRFVLNG